MHLAEYQRLATQHRRPETETENNLVIYPAMALAGEAGEVANDTKKYMRGQIRIAELRKRSATELGDVLWYVTAMATDLQLTIDHIAHQNIAKVDHTYGRPKA